MAWNFNPKGDFSVGSLRRCLEGEGTKSVDKSKEIWNNVCPKKVEMFMWQAICGRIMVNDVWLRICGINAASTVCNLCNNGEEFVDHLLLHCFWTEVLWNHGMSWWGVKSCKSKSVKDWLWGWSGLCPEAKYARAWGSLFSTVVWTTWETRNHLIFKGSKADSNQAIDMVKCRIVWWFKHIGRGSSETITSMLNNIKDVCIQSKPKKTGVAWFMATSNARYPEVQCRRVGKRMSWDGRNGWRIAESLWRVLGLFSIHLGVHDSNTAEILAIHKACEMCVANPVFQETEVIIVSDSMVAISWVNGAGFGSLKHVRTIYDVRSMLSLHGNMKIIHNPRASNSFVDMLANMGTNNEGDLMFLGD
ncbi:hypothetical protein Dsin_006848 [Dipteronia sinensis]|uniref:Reverse transcriptase zinc-binding domain-containing protein n=1 Tax=Dipteronia sinensis TaxID=43782 RepID=A0AAE0EG02_9ROSI|nr:hypothetical protein Dsin_006848 [Dipteronia sinensis]